MIRPATSEDAERILQIGTHMHAESPAFQGRDFNQGKVRTLIHGVIRDDAACLFVAELNGEIVGVVSGYITPTYFGDDLVAQDFLLFILPEHRGATKTALRLLIAFKDWGHSKGAEVVLGNSAGITDDERFGKLLSRAGFQPSGRIYKA